MFRFRIQPAMFTVVTTMMKVVYGSELIAKFEAFIELANVIQLKTQGIDFFKYLVTWSEYILIYALLKKYLILDFILFDDFMFF